MNKKILKLLAVIMTAVMIFSSAVFLTSAENNKKDIVYETDTFYKYKDGDYYRYVGPTGDISDDFSDATAVISSAQEYYETQGIRTKDIAKTGADSLPSSFDLSESKYFPPVGDQGGLGSCATFSAVYYQFSYAVNENRDVAATYENTRSPQVVFNYIASGSSDGTTHLQNYSFLELYGAATMADIPYSDKDQMNWHAYKNIWREGLRARLKDYYIFEELGEENTQITSPDDSDLDAIKTALLDGKVLGYSTTIESWVHSNLKTNPDAPGNNAYAGQEVIYACDGTKGPHAMAIVGYNDDIWSDINGNDKVDSGEMGAFKIVNSWSDRYANKGFNWVAYDALNKVSSVEGCPFNNKQPIFTAIRSINVRDYNDLSDMYFEYTVNTARRNQHEVIFTAEKDGTIQKFQMFYGAGGGYTSESNALSFEGSADTPCDGVLVCALDNIAPDFKYEDFDSYNWSVEIKDTLKDSNPVIVKDVRLVNELTGEVYTVNDTQQTLDGSSVSFDVKHTTTNNKVVYYVGYDNPTLHYKIGNGEFEEIKLTENLERIGATHKHIFYDVEDDITLYFEGENGEIDDNNGQYYTATDRLNFYRTESAREKIKITDVNIPQDYDVLERFFFDVETTGGYTPFLDKYTIENLDTGEVKVIDYYQNYEKSHSFYTAGKYRVTVEITDQAGDISSFSKVIDVIDRQFSFDRLEQKDSKTFVGDTAHFTAYTKNESIKSWGPIKSLYTFDVKDSTGEIIYTETRKSTSMHMGLRESVIDFEYVPEKAGEYTLTVSSTDGSNDYAEETISYTVYDKLFGDANLDTSISITDATIVQRFCASIIDESGLNYELSDCNNDEKVGIIDATLIQRYVAQLNDAGRAGQALEYIPPVKPTEPPTEPPTETPTVNPTEPEKENIVTFTDSFNWGGTMYCYYWSDQNKAMTTWPGIKMTKIANNDFGQAMYTFTVPKEANYIIFTNGSKQTADIPYSGGEVRYYPIAETDSNGHNKVNTW